MKPILFNTEMVRAILEGRKTVTRRVVKPQHLRVLDSPYHKEHPETPDKVLLERLCEPPYQLGQTLYVRETWAAWSRTYGFAPEIHYKADGETLPGVKWRPSIHMTREAARIFLRVTDVRMERLQDITPDQIDAEGCKEWAYSAKTGELLPSGPSWFRIAWDNTLKPKDRALYGWQANPWVWVVEFERIGSDETPCPPTT